MKNISAVLEQWQKQQKANWQIKLMLGWNEALGDLSEQVTLVSIANENRIIVGASSAEWMHELRFLSDEIINKVNSWLGAYIVHEISFVRHYTAKKQIIPNKKNLMPRQVTVTHFSIIPTTAESKLLEQIIDAEFKTALLQFLARCKKK